MSRMGLYRVLNFPFVFSLSQALLAPGSNFFLQKQYRIVFEGSKGVVLDVGCGPSLATPMPNGFILGCDINHKYVTRYTKPVKNKRKSEMCSKNYKYACLGVVCSAEFLPFFDSTFDQTRCSGLLHHLPTEIAVRTIKEMLRCTRSFGKIILCDAVWPKSPIRRPLAWITQRLDRGAWVRTEEQLLNLCNTAYHGHWQHRRFTSTFTGLEEMSLTIELTA